MVVASESEISKTAEQLVERAKAEVASQLLEAQNHISEQTQRAKDAGAAQGRSGAQHLQEKLPTFRQNLLEQLKHEFLSASLELAHEWLTQWAHSDPQAVVPIAQAALTHVGEADKIVVRVNAQDVASIRRNIDHLKSFVPNAQTIEVREDPQVGRGGVLLQTNLGVVDAQIKTQIDEVFQSLE